MNPGSYLHQNISVTHFRIKYSITVSRYILKLNIQTDTFSNIIKNCLKYIESKHVECRRKLLDIAEPMIGFSATADNTKAINAQVNNTQASNKHSNNTKTTNSGVNNTMLNVLIKDYSDCISPKLHCQGDEVSNERDFHRLCD